jgi:hypothetical protein
LLLLLLEDLLLLEELPPDEPPLEELRFPELEEFFDLLDELFELDEPLELDEPFEVDEPFDLLDEPFLLLLFDFVSATFMHLVFAGIGRDQVGFGFLRGTLAGDREAVEELALQALALLVGDRALVVVELQLQELPFDVVLVVEAAVGLVGDLLGDPGGPPHRGERQQHKLLEKAHG